ncbi:MAG: TonB-dependent receptor [Xanthomonadales bacterium]|nr:TonB-dependent receptor [Xanthomonadales bacterium]
MIPARTLPGTLAVLLAWTAGGAQPPDEAESALDETARLETVIVTGSRLGRIELEGSLPVAVVDREALEREGFVLLGDVLRRVASNSFGSFNGSLPSLGAGLAEFDLRGLGAGRTLVLIDGHRVALDSQSRGASANLSLIPIAAVERVEVLRDGASAVYGSDAIGGVVNIITRKDLFGTELLAQVTRPDKPGLNEHRIDLAHGFELDRGSLMVTLSAPYREGLFDDDRAITDFDRNGGVSGFTELGDPPSYLALDFFANGTFVPGPVTAAPACPPPRVAPFGIWDESDPLTGDRPGPITETVCLFDFSDDAMQLPALRPRYGTVHVNHDFGPRLRGFGRLLAADVTTEFQLAAAAKFDLTDPLIMLPNNPDHPEFDPGAGRAPSPILLAFRMDDLGPRRFTLEETSVDVLLGLEWLFETGDLELSAHHMESDLRALLENHGRYPALQQAILAGSYNPFGDDNDPEVIEAIRTDYRFEGESSFSAVNLSWRSGIFSDVLNRELGYVIGGDLRRDALRSVPAGPFPVEEVFTPVNLVNVDADRSAWSLFTEWRIPLGDHVDLMAAGRYDGYSEPDDGEFTAKFSARWQPADQLALRVSAGQGFRVPTLSQMFSGDIISLVSAVDLVACDAAGNDPGDSACQARNINFTITGNAFLEPETSDQFSLGAVWAPRPGLELSIDYYRIEMDDQIERLPVESLFFLELNDNLPPGVSVARTEVGDLVGVTSAFVNMGGAATDGVDLGLDWRFEPGDLGSFHFHADLSNVFSFERSLGPGSPTREQAGFTIDDLGGAPEWRTGGGLSWSRGNWSVDLVVFGVDGYRDVTPEAFAAGTPGSEVDEWWTIDLAAGWKLPWGGKATLGVRNVLDEAPPFADIGSHPKVDVRNHSLRGRTWWLRYEQEF